MFMSDATPAPEDAHAAAPQGSPTGTPKAARVTTSAGLLSLLTRLLDVGRAMLAELQGHDGPDAPPGFVHRFATTSLTLVIARITRGIMLAQALHDRVTRNARRLDAPDRPSPGDRPTQERPDHPRPPPVNEEAELLALPSAQEIADRIRHRPIGAVIEEICRDLGITGSHALWREVLDAITYHGGDCGRLGRIIIQRGFDAAERDLPPPPLPAWAERMMATEGWLETAMRAADQAVRDLAHSADAMTALEETIAAMAQAQPFDLTSPLGDDLFAALASTEPPALATPPP